MGLLQFLFYRKKETSILASRKYGEHQVDSKDLDQPLLARRRYPTFEEREKSMKLGKVSMLARKEYPKVFTEAEKEDNKSL